MEATIGPSAEKEVGPVTNPASSPEADGEQNELVGDEGREDRDLPTHRRPRRVTR
jgi:hypothetical protein